MRRAVLSPASLAVLMSGVLGLAINSRWGAAPHVVGGATALDTTEVQSMETAVRVCHWYSGKKAALSLRFDDSHPTHIERAVPMLNEYGLVGTFLINPGRDAYQQHREIWERDIVRQGHELANHTLNHRGARTDREAETEIGQPARLIHAVQPDRKLVSFTSGGKTLWFQRKPVEFFTAKYGMYPRSRGAQVRMSCTEDYPWFSPDAFLSRLDEAIAEGAWMEAWFHPIGEGHLGISPAAFRQVLAHTQSRLGDTWQASKGSIIQYARERDAAILWTHAEGDDALLVYFSCATDPDYYDQPLTLEIDLPPEADTVDVSGPDGQAVKVRVEQTSAGRVGRLDVPPVDAIYTVHSKGIGTPSRGISTADLIDPGPHPYLFFGEEDIEDLRVRTDDPQADAMWSRLIRKADSLLANAPEQAAAQRARPSRSQHIRILAFAYAMTGQTSYADKARAEIEAVCKDRSWHMPNADAHVTARTTCSLALAYDWMHDYLTDNERCRLRATIVSHGLEPIVAATRNADWWTDWYRCNWGCVVYGQAGVAALSILADEPRASEWVRLCRQKIWHYTQSIGRDGGWGESATYGAFAWSNAFPFMRSLRRMTDGRVDLFDSARLRELATWFVWALEPDGKGFVPFANCGTWTGDAAEVLYGLAAEYRDGIAQYVAEQMSVERERPDIFGFLWYDPTLEPQAPNDLPRAMVFSDIDWAFLRSRWNDPGAILFALKGGQKDWDHQHHDTNHFVLYAHGEPLIVDLNYPYDIWGCQTEAHNTVMVNGKDQRGTVRVEGNRGEQNHRGIVSGLVNTSWYSRVVGDASLAYSQHDVASAVREVLYLRRDDDLAPPDYFILFDDIDGIRPCRMDWLLHTYGSIQVDGDVVTVRQNDAAVDVAVISPYPFVHEVREKSLDAVRASKPFPGADTLRFIEVRAAEPVQRGRFLSVLMPRPCASPTGPAVTRVEADGLLGAILTFGRTSDIALFALDSPHIEANGVAAEGRTCFVRRSERGVARAALHSGQRISVDGCLLFETDSCGDALLTFGEDSTEAELSLYNSDLVRIHVPSEPVRVLVNGEERPFAYEESSHCVRLDYDDIRTVKIPQP